MIGIYKLVCLSNKKVYIGSSLNIDFRIKQHFKCLKGNYHINKHLQFSWNKYGEENFLSFVEEDLTENKLDSLVEKEFEYMQKYSSLDKNFGFNKAHPLAPGFLSGKEYYFVSPEGIEFSGSNISEFAREQSLDRSTLSYVNLGKRFQINGWTNSLLNHEILQVYGSYRAFLENKDKTWILEHEIYGRERIFNLSSFCKKYGLTTGNAGRVLSGVYKESKGWKKVNDD